MAGYGLRRQPPPQILAVSCARASSGSFYASLTDAVFNPGPWGGHFAPASYSFGLPRSASSSWIVLRKTCRGRLHRACCTTGPSGRLISLKEMSVDRLPEDASRADFGNWVEEFYVHLEGVGGWAGISALFKEDMADKSAPQATRSWSSRTRRTTRAVSSTISK